MNAIGKDSEEVVQFRQIFCEVKKAASDQPSKLPLLAHESAEIADMCRRLDQLGRTLRTAERQRRKLFAGPLDPSFITAWRDFEQRYERVVSLFGLFELIDEIPPAKPYEEATPQLADTWKAADAHGFVAKDSLEKFIDFGFEQGTDESRWPAEFIEEIHEGVGAWAELVDNAEFDLKGVLRRRRLIPFVLVPRHVDQRSGSSSGSLFYETLSQAQLAFVYGAPNAALALMRALLEAIIREHYGAKDANLVRLISSVSDRVPDDVPLDSLDSLRKLANNLLHIYPEKELAKWYQDMDEQAREKEIVSYLTALRALIEGVE